MRDRRGKNRLDQKDLAALAGVGTRFISNLEGAKPTARLDVIDKVLRVFGKTLGIVDAPRPEHDDDA